MLNYWLFAMRSIIESVVKSIMRILIRQMCDGKLLNISLEGKFNEMKVTTAHCCESRTMRCLLEFSVGVLLKDSTLSQVLSSLEVCLIQKSPHCHIQFGRDWQPAHTNRAIRNSHLEFRSFHRFFPQVFSVFRRSFGCSQRPFMIFDESTICQSKLSHLNRKTNRHTHCLVAKHMLINIVDMLAQFSQRIFIYIFIWMIASFIVYYFVCHRFSADIDCFGRRIIHQTCRKQ